MSLGTGCSTLKTHPELWSSVQRLCNIPGDLAPSAIVDLCQRMARRRIASRWHSRFKSFRIGMHSKVEIGDATLVTCSEGVGIANDYP